MAGQFRRRRSHLRPRRISRAWPFALMGVLVLFPFADLLRLSPDQTILGKDWTSMFLPWWQFAADALRRGELPLWNPYLFSGVPFIANPQPALFYPPVWLLLLLSPQRAIVGLLLLHLWIAGAGMFAWLRREGATRGGALFGGAAFAFSGAFAVRIDAGHVGVVMTLAWLPTVLWACHRALRRGWVQALQGGLPLALAFLAGHTASFVYVALVLAAYLAYNLWTAWRAGFPMAPPLRLGITMILAGMGIAAVQLLPTAQFVLHSIRSRADYAFAATYSWPPGYLVTLLIPNFFGGPRAIGYWGDGLYAEFVFYTGLLPLWVTLVWLSRARRLPRSVPFLAVLGGWGLLAALGKFGILHRLAWNYLPLFRSMRAPARAGFLFAFAVAATGGIAVSALQRGESDVWAAVRRGTRGVAFWLPLLIAVVLVLGGYLRFTLERDTNPQVGRFWHVANYSALFLITYVLSVGVMRAWGEGRLSPRAGVTLALGILLLDLWGYDRDLLTPRPAEPSTYWRVVAETVDTDAGRVLPWGLSIFEQNKGMAWGVESIFGYDPLELARYHRFAAASDPRARAYDLLRARYLVSGQAMTFPDEANAPRLLAARDGVWVYERPTALPAAWLVHRVEVHDVASLLVRLEAPDFDPRTVALLERDLPCSLTDVEAPERVTVVHRGYNYLDLVVHAQADALLILSEPDYPGWRAVVDGRRAPLLRADYALRAVCVPAGEHRVTVRYIPPLLGVGAVITAATMGLMLWLTVRRRGGAEPGP